MSKDAGLYAWIKREEAEGTIYQEIDGFWVWAPRGDHGFLNEYALTKLVEYLTAKNALWQWQIDNDPAIGGDTMREEYDLTGGERGKFYKREP